jgi:transcriptional regulator with XRE-family HTH domain
MKEFTEWLQVEMKSRKWGIPDLARSAHITRGAIGNILRGYRSPGPDLCTAISRALKLPPEAVFRKAGLLPALPKENIRIEEISEITRCLDDAEQEDLLRYARMRMGIHEDRGKK